MLNYEDNELLCRVGPGTAMGALMRQYWIPAAVSREFPKPDSPPVRIKLLGEPLVAFRDTDGNVGLVGAHCPHRRAQLFFGRNEEGGLRCVYHGWKFDTSGACLDMPSEPCESNFKQKIKIPAYPTVERNGVVWAYMGSRKTPPPLPELEANMRADSTVTVLHRRNNWLQGLEGEMDTLHVAFLHQGNLRPDNTEPGSFFNYQAKSRAGKFSVLATAHGTSYGLYRPAEEDTHYWRIGHVLFPFYAMVPGILNELGKDITLIAYVPIDDEHTLEWNIRVPRPDSQAPPQPQREYLPNTSGWYGRFNITQSYENDFLIDREAQARGESFTGISGVRQQDMAMTESMGPIVDRSLERLGTTDSMIIRTRRRLLEAVRAMQQDGTVPPGVDEPEVYHERSGQITLPRNVDWWEATRDLRERFDAAPPEKVVPR